MALFARKTSINTTDEDICPYLAQVCIKSRCKLWTHIMGRHPQSGADIDMYDCAIKWMPILAIEASKETREAGAAIESFRNEVVRQGEQAIQLTRENPQQQIRIAHNGKRE